MTQTTNNSNIKQLYSSVITGVDDDFDDFQPLKNIAQRFNINPAHIAIGLVVFISLFTLATTLLSHFLITLFGLIYPSYMSFKAIKKQKEDVQKKWLTYWIVFGFVTAFDRLLGFLLFFLPSYYTFKLLFIIWLFYPRTNGAFIVYEKFMKPQLLKIKQQSKKLHRD